MTFLKNSIFTFFRIEKFSMEFFMFWWKINLKPTFATIIGNPIEIDSFFGICWYWSEISNWWKFRGENVIIFSQNMKNVFIISETMFLGQENKYNGKFRAADSKNLPKPWYFHQKSSKIIDFSWFSLSELPYSKSQQPTCSPRVVQSALQS